MSGRIENAQLRVFSIGAMAPGLLACQGKKALVKLFQSR